ncbi:CMGC family protein kinase [Trichomonas vaginalis G3]|uniref:non-specific serine/threonine protein kinase n=1 Tax=Trichomonas vaginalis (strain ATCC PRA-98 / G3) TaxID=412133 RepID=A2GVE7_TRIV3|nr:STKc CK2 alpha domain-containing protein [Trichomonas vaginalis G3]EAX78870.1 CMGC family protein kinase [Trichomonas vaginalis G3]KAI5490928.1 STKc CK2 alpha domain-containing protein [Trichomonas vaginalis G3]|eukprot:XP_001291800.1 CMGC family protein kinase [Trichomonas vaginalis G3]
MDYDHNNILISVSKVYADVNQQKGPEWYDHKSYEPQWNLPDNYSLIKKVGRGKYSTVFKAVHKRRTECAIKILVPLDPKRYLREIKILTNLAGQKNIVRLLDLVKDPMTGIYSFVFEWVDFYDWRSLYTSFTIHDIRLYMYKLLCALDTAHSLGIMHRDIKPQNIAIDKEHRRLRLLDWGLADFYHPKQKYNSHVATRVFKPPELLICYPYYDYSMDIWSAGLTFSIMMFKRIVIECGEDDPDQLLKVADLVGGAGILNYADSLGVDLDDSTRQQLVRRPGTGWEKHRAKVAPELCPPDALDLLNRMMTIDHRERITARDAMKHAFFKPLLDPLKTHKVE